jgi:uracil phosphoribosyltransferase
MLDAFQMLLPGSPVGFVAVRRDEETAAPVWFYDSVPEVDGRSVIILDPMLATGGTSGEVVEFLRSRGAGHLTLASIVAAPEGVAGLRRFEDLLVITASVDRDLDQRKFIRPGLGDFGDRLFSGRD